MGAGLERVRTRILRTPIPYVSNPSLVWIWLGLGPYLTTNVSAQKAASDDIRYGEHRSRLPIGVTVFWIVVFFASLALYTLWSFPRSPGMLYYSLR